MDPLTISMIIAISTLFIERLFAYSKKISKSECSTCCKVEMK